MPDFEKHLARHGEFTIQDIIERLERYEGIRNRTDVPLQERWNAVMKDKSFQKLLAA